MTARETTMVKQSSLSIGLLLGMTALRCSADDEQGPCAAALSKLRSCNLITAGESDCDSSNAEDDCIARCFSEATCTELRDFYCADDGPLVSCREACSPSFRCEDGETIPADYQCDVEADCADGSDEIGCPPGTAFQCESGESIPAEWECDGTADCADLSDEIGCESIQGFVCANGETVPTNWQCDGDADCSDGTDEQDCPELARIVCE
jgi:hypothetical protein